MKILITAGPTQEAVDPVRYLTNRSSGKMGYALAAAAAKRGHRVLLISGPTALDLPEGVDFLPVVSAADMYQAVESQLDKQDIAIFAAAVADYTPAHVADHKIKKDGDQLTLVLEKTKDILGSARSVMNFSGALVGFAAETENLEDNARGKLQRKGCDLVVGNDVSRKDIGFDSSENEVLLVYPDRTESLPKDNKDHLAYHLIELIEDLAPNPATGQS
ncbi:phosphopantothenoylcysteine decarboxylase [Akkermansiaceae bacterium]|nr:phosphopantothenoylcysteine decarboxylase [Akkermansiaceae bacterium]MDB4287685.1 phosphopantothenoylcysteine decarboxylase [bacterium]MDA7672303.1 phosphopantothenoylcysteine decarboxylase [Akkermansiaceae bacterium]MDB4267806.1 phosphopantothenoylcysteine decarboxylase [Akkermansiaceae bacterium]MDB4305212.1 phosphopantothenoylcysteine decarboxylase [Akkermansiaceae bacterium]